MSDDVFKQIVVRLLVAILWRLRRHLRQDSRRGFSALECHAEGKESELLAQALAQTQDRDCFEVKEAEQIDELTRDRDGWIKNAADTATEMDRLLEALKLITEHPENALAIASVEIRAHWLRMSFRKEKPAS